MGFSLTIITMYTAHFTFILSINKTCRILTVNEAFEQLLPCFSIKFPTKFKRNYFPIFVTCRPLA